MSLRGGLRSLPQPLIHLIRGDHPVVHGAEPTGHDDADGAGPASLQALDLRTDTLGEKLGNGQDVPFDAGRFEAELSQIDKGLSKKGFTKKRDKVNQRIGRLNQRYSRVAHVRKATQAELDLQQLYQVLGITMQPGGIKKMSL